MESCGEFKMSVTAAKIIELPTQQFSAGPVASQPSDDGDSRPKTFVMQTSYRRYVGMANNRLASSGRWGDVPPS
jgi:hypothetical protein